MVSFSTFTERLDLGFRLACAYAFVVLLFVLNVIAIPYPLAGAVKVPFFLMALYYWSVYRPTLIPPWMAFAFGFLMDVLSGFPLGLNAVIFVTVQWVAGDQRRFLAGQSFFMIWFGFALSVVCALVFQTLIFGFIHMRWPSFYEIGTLLALSIIIFPPICVLLHLTHKLLPVPPALKRFKTKV